METTSLAVIQQDDLETIQRTARMLAVSGYFDAKGESPVALAQMAVKILAGRELGFGPFAAVRGIHIIQGAPSISANLMAGAVRSNPRYDYRIREHTDKVCRLEFFMHTGDKWESLGMSEFTADDAKRAQTKNMDKYPRNMLFARAMSNGVRFYCPDVFSGIAVYTPEELDADIDADGDVIDAMPVQRPQLPSTSKHTAPIPNGTQQPPDAPTEQVEQAGEDDPFADVLAPNEIDLIDSWSKPADAYVWAIDAGACQNEFEAKNSMKKILDARFGGELKKPNLRAALVAFYQRQQEKLLSGAAAPQPDAA